MESNIEEQLNLQVDVKPFIASTAIITEIGDDKNTKVIQEVQGCDGTIFTIYSDEQNAIKVEPRDPEEFVESNTNLRFDEPPENNEFTEPAENPGFNGHKNCLTYDDRSESSVPLNNRSGNNPKCIELEILTKKPFVCESCGKSFTREPSLRDHKKRMHSGKTYTCAHCSRTFNKRASLANHIKSHSVDVETDTPRTMDGTEFQCRFCYKTFLNRSGHKRHEATHIGERPFKCEECNAAFTTISGLGQHIKTVHRGIKPFQCRLCSKTFQQRNNLRRHENTHTGEKLFQCIECNSAFASNGGLIQHHAIVHIGIKPYQCDQCSKRFALRGVLNRHLQTHIGDLRERRFKCEECDKTFFTKGTLVKHQKGVHLRIYSVECEECLEVFATKVDLRLHLMDFHLHVGSEADQQNKVESSTKPDFIKNETEISKTELEFMGNKKEVEPQLIKKESE